MILITEFPALDIHNVPVFVIIALLTAQDPPPDINIALLVNPVTESPPVKFPFIIKLPLPVC